MNLGLLLTYIHTFLIIAEEVKLISRLFLNFVYLGSYVHSEKKNTFTEDLWYSS
jgi:hypothetical protein